MSDCKPENAGRRSAQLVSVETDARFNVFDLPSGEYLVAPVQTTDPGRWPDAVFFEGLRVPRRA